MKIRPIQIITLLVVLGVIVVYNLSQSVDISDENKLKQLISKETFMDFKVLERKTLDSYDAVLYESELERGVLIFDKQFWGHRYIGRSETKREAGVFYYKIDADHMLYVFYGDNTVLKAEGLYFSYGGKTYEKENLKDFILDAIVIYNPDPKIFEAYLYDQNKEVLLDL